MSAADRPAMRNTLSLVHDAQAGQRAALELALDRVRPRLERWIAVRLGPLLRSRLDVEDVVQETLLGAWKAFDAAEFNSRGDVFAWLRRISENRIRDLASRHTAKKRDAARNRALEHSIISSQTGPGTRMDRALRQERMLLALAKLSAADREILRLTKIELRPHGEIAELLNIKVGAVAVRAFRALKRLQALLEAEDAQADGAADSGASAQEG